MLNHLIQFSLRNIRLVLILFLAISLLGAVMAFRMDVDVLPDLTAVNVTVLTESAGYSAQEVEQLVTFPIETTLNGAAHVRRIRSSSMMGISVVWVEFDWGTDVQIARQIVTEKLASIQFQLPRDVAKPVLAPSSSIMGEIMLIGLSSPTASQKDLRTLAQWQLRPRILATGGVAEVNIIGGEVAQYQIQVKTEKLGYYGISLAQVLDAISPMNQNSSGGFFNDFGQEYVIRGIGRSQSIADLSNILIQTQDQQPVKLSDLATVQISHAPKIGSAAINGEESVILVVQRQLGENTLRTTEKIDQVLDTIQDTVPSDITIHRRVFRQADFIKVAIQNVSRALLEGGVFVVIVLGIFLMNWRATLISVVTIPIALLSAVITLKCLGFSINTMSLGGMAIAVGSLVDDAIIDVENVFRRVRQNAALAVDRQLPLTRVIFDASSEIRQSVWYSTLMIVVAFAPLFFLSGMEGRLLRPLGISFVVSLLASMLVALSLTPVLCQLLLGRYQPKSQEDTGLMRLLKRGYQWGLVRSLRVPKLVLGTSAVAVVLTVILATQLGQSFLPPFNEGSLVINVTAVPGISLDESKQIARQVEQILLTFPELKLLSRRTGRAELDEHAQGVNVSEFDLPFELKERSKDEFLTQIRTQLAQIPGVSVSIGQPIGHRIDHMLSGSKSNIVIKLFGSDLNQLFQLGKQIETIIAPISGVVDLSVEPQIEVPEIHITPKHDLLLKYGIPLNEFLSFVKVGFSGEVLGQMIQKDSRSDIVLKLDFPDQNRIEAIRQTRIQTPSGESIPLHYVANIKSVTGPHTIHHENTQRKVVVSANVSGRDLVGTFEELRLEIDRNLKLPSGVYIDYGGQFENQKTASRLLLWTSLGAILVIFWLLCHQFQSTALALIVLLNLPLALIGGVVMVKLSSGIVSIASLIGFITLFGIALRNGMLLISQYQITEHETNLDDQILHGSLERLAPILMTALTTGLALLPLALQSNKAGNEIQSPMAMVILGGLLSCTFLNLFVIPAAYKWYKTQSGQWMRWMNLKSKLKILILVTLLGCMSSPVLASDFDMLTEEILQKHPSLQVLRAQISADKLQANTGLTFQNPELSLDFLDASNNYQNELILSQSFDFPTVYGIRKNLSVLSHQERDSYLQYETFQFRQAIRLMLIELAYLNKRVQAQENRVNFALKVAQEQAFQYQQSKRSIAQLNKAKTDLARKQAQLDRWIQDRDALLQTMKRWGQLKDTAALLKMRYPDIRDNYPARMELIAPNKHPRLRYLQQLSEQTRMKVLLQSAENLPDFQIGYHYQKSFGTEYNGIHMGLSIPLQENAYQLEAKTQRYQSVQSQYRFEEEQIQQDFSTAIGRFNQFYKTLKRFEETLRSVHDDKALNQAYRMGQLSAAEYFFELEFYYDTIDEFLEMEKATYAAWNDTVSFL